MIIIVYIWPDIDINAMWLFLCVDYYVFIVYMYYTHPSCRTSMLVKTVRIIVELLRYFLCTYKLSVKTLVRSCLILLASCGWYMCHRAPGFSPASTRDNVFSQHPADFIALSTAVVARQYTLWVKKNPTTFFVNNFAKGRSIFKILSPLDSGRNSQ